MNVSCSVLIVTSFPQTLTSAKKTSRVVMLMLYAIIPLDHIFALVKLDTLGMGRIVEVKLLNGFKPCLWVVVLRIY